MKGIELSRLYWQEAGRPAFAKELPELLERAAVGLVGEGSECFGFDDAISRDHDWGPGFCIWLTDADFVQYGAAAAAIYSALPKKYMGFERMHILPQTQDRVGVMRIGSFFSRYTGFEAPPFTNAEWRMMPEAGLSVVTNGEVFHDPAGIFSNIRQEFMNYFPEDVRLKKLTAACVLAAQSGQYNYPRCIRRSEHVAAFQALATFIEQAQKIVFLLNKRYVPYYKWTHRMLGTLPLLGKTAAELLTSLTEDPMNCQGAVEAFAAMIIDELKRQNLTDADSDFLLGHAEAVQRRITDPALRKLHIMAE